MKEIVNKDNVFEMFNKFKSNYSFFDFDVFFKKMIENNFNVTALLDSLEFNYNNFEKGFLFIRESLIENSKILLNVDEDVDGFCSAKVLYNTLRNCEVALKKNFTNVYLHLNQKKEHSVTNDFIDKAINENFKLCIISDTGSNNREQILKLLKNNIKVIVLDHHEIENFENFGDNCCFINSTLFKSEHSKISAGTLCFFFARNFVKKMFNANIDYMIEYPALSLISDMCEMNDFNSKILLINAISLNKSNVFLELSNKYYGFNQNFGWVIAPKINFLFREGHMQLVKELIEENDLMNTLSKINQNYIDGKNMVDNYLQNAIRVDGKNISYVEIKNNGELKHAVEYTGLVCNKIENILNRPIICGTLENELLKLSIRTKKKSNIYDLFVKSGCCGGGHKNAVGFHCKKEEFVKIFDFFDENILFEKENDVLKLEIDNIRDFFEFATKNNLLMMFGLYNECCGVFREKIKFLYKLNPNDVISIKGNLDNPNYSIAYLSDILHIDNLGFGSIKTDDTISITINMIGNRPNLFLEKIDV